MNLRSSAVLAAAAVTALLGAGTASASVLTFDPSATNGGTLALDSHVGAFGVSGGDGTVYQNIDIHSNGSYSGDIVVNLTDFGAQGANGLGTGTHGWSLFAIVSISGTGTWSGNTFTAGTSSLNMQLYGVNNSLSIFGVGFVDPQHSNAGVPGSGSVTNSQMALNFGVGGVGGFPLGGDACIDSPIVSDCILLASGSSTDNDLTVTKGGRRTSPQEDFVLNALLLADPSIDVANGFFAGSIPDGMNLTINSGPGPGDGTIHPQVTGDPDVTSCTGLLDFFQSCSGLAVNWDANVNGDPVPEPGSLALFGTALLGLGAARRWRKRS